VYVEGGYGLHCDERQCNYCTGTLHSTPSGDIVFCHDQNCMFSNNSGEGGETDNEDEYDDCNLIPHDGFRGEEGAGGPYAENEEQDVEGDREVELLKRRLERYDYMRGMRKMRPNISNEWINKLREILRILSNHGANSNSRGNAPSPPQ
jgi:hypothetical protein